MKLTGRFPTVSYALVPVCAKFHKGPSAQIFQKKYTPHFDRESFSDSNGVLGIAKSGLWHVFRPKNQQQVWVEIFREKTKKTERRSDRAYGEASTTAQHSPTRVTRRHKFMQIFYISKKFIFEEVCFILDFQTLTQNN